MLFRRRRKREPPRLKRERKTILVMVHIYCRGQHMVHNGLCEDCERLLAYAMCRLDRCPFGAEKPTCVQCPIHCYRKERRNEIVRVMRYAGPRMLWRHPLLAIRHLLDGRRPAPGGSCRGHKA